MIIKLECPSCDKGFSITEEVLQRMTSMYRNAPEILCPKCRVKANKKRVNDFSRGMALKYKYGITVVEYNEIFKNQNYSCKICKEKPKKKRLHVDHDHATGKNRGLLCHRCNLMLGCARDKISILKDAINYLTGGKT